MTGGQERNGLIRVINQIAHQTQMIHVLREPEIMSEDRYILAEQNREGVALHSVLACPYCVLIERPCPNLMKSSETKRKKQLWKEEMSQSTFEWQIVSRDSQRPTPHSLVNIRQQMKDARSVRMQAESDGNKIHFQATEIPRSEMVDAGRWCQTLK